VGCFVRWFALIAYEGLARQGQREGARIELRGGVGAEDPSLAVREIDVAAHLERDVIQDIDACGQPLHLEAHNRRAGDEGLPLEVAD